MELSPEEREKIYQEEKVRYEAQEKIRKEGKRRRKSNFWLLFLGLIFVVWLASLLSGKDTTSNNHVQSTARKQSIEQAEKDLRELMRLAQTAKIVKSYEFSKNDDVVYVNPQWYLQDVKFKKDFLAKVSNLKETITGYHHFEVRDAFSNEKVAEVTAFSGSLEVYK